MQDYTFQLGECFYLNPLSSTEHIQDWKMEGNLKYSFHDEALHLENSLDSEKYGDNAHWVIWCPFEFPDEIAIQWEFSPIHEPGLCMLFFAAVGQNGRDLFDASLQARSGFYPQYHSGDINALHLSYFRRKHAEERAFQTCNLRKSHGFHLVSTGADPLPSPEDANATYYLKLIKYREYVQFSINDLTVLSWKDAGEFGPVFGGGKIGFRQMAPMIAAYRNLSVHKVF
ncbi:DUF1961 family protein [Bacillus sp. FSL K6-3431]|uniref:DUF1961 family protein n=1 Tax=Bacillus sp. FSL K6-3431 TaxID=2921500 RepID=UPI0030FB03DC